MVDKTLHIAGECIKASPAIKLIDEKNEYSKFSCWFNNINSEIDINIWYVFFYDTYGNYN